MQVKAIFEIIASGICFVGYLSSPSCIDGI